MYPKCGCPTECRVCNTLAKRDKNPKKQVRAVIVFKAGITPPNIEEMVKALGKDVVEHAEIKEFVPPPPVKLPASGVTP